MTDQLPRRRRRFRFRLRTLLLLPVLVSMSWWWLTWPERTARRFVELLSAGKFVAAQDMFDGPPLFEFWPDVPSGMRPSERVRMRKRTWRQVLDSRRAFMAEESPGRLFHFEAVRGRVHFDELTMAYDLKYVSAKSLSDSVRLITDREDIRVAEVEGQRRVLVTIPQDDLSPVKKPEWVHIGLVLVPPGERPIPRSAEQMHTLMAQLIPLIDTPEIANLPPVVWPIK